MSLLVDDEYLRRRSQIASGPLAPLAASLSNDLENVTSRPLFVPDRKALLSREGGRCPRDGRLLDFDPFAPHEHRCPGCGEVYRSELHDRFWIYWYQLWLAERAVHAALLSRLGVQQQGEEFAARVLSGYGDQYLRYPNVDNALGPTRPFFSTYVESIWLLQLCVAASFLDPERHRKVLGKFKEVVVEPSLALIESYDEGRSNRQVWNSVAIIAANQLLDREDRAEEAFWAEHGIAAHIEWSLLDDGSWYEGENYHLFAHRGLWYGLELANHLQIELDPELRARFDRGFTTPFLTSLPDLTFASRRDSQYAVSIRQWRFAEWCELGLSKRDDRVLGGMLARLYDNDAAAGETGRWKSTAEAERNLPPVRLTRADLGWKSLLFAREVVPLDHARPLGSLLLEGQGIGVIRRDAGKVYVALDYGVSGGGHGHPDRLNLLLTNGEQRILDDMGSGSYVHPSLHWYRSSLAHNAPFLDRRSQPRVDGVLVAYEDRGAAGWISAAAPLGSDGIVTRSVVTMSEYVVDEVIGGEAGRTLDLPLHADLLPRASSIGAPQTLPGSDGLEDGFRFAREAQLIASGAANETVSLTGPAADVWLASSAPFEIWRMVGPGAPGKPDAPFVMIRCEDATTIRSVWSWNGSVKSAKLFPVAEVELERERHVHSAVTHGWNIAIHVGGAKSTIDLEGRAPEAELVTETSEIHSRAPVERKPTPLRRGKPIKGALGEDHYHRSEESWRDAGAPVADVELMNDGGALRIVVDVRAARSFAPLGAANRLDNEHADINGAGLQLYLASGHRLSGYVIVPVAGTPHLNTRPIDGWGDAIPVSASWRETAKGYRVELVVLPPDPVVSVSLIVNEKPEGRERRRGQLILPTTIPAEYRWIYLRGDRHPTGEMIDLHLET